MQLQAIQRVLISCWKPVYRLTSLSFWIRACIFLVVVAVAAFWHRIITLSGPIIDLLLFIGGGVLTAFISILGGHVATDRKGYRSAFYLSGTILAGIIVVTGIRNYRTALTTPTSAAIVMDAVNKADAHTDSEVAMVREDLKKASDHSDQQLGVVRTDLNNSTRALSSKVSETETKLTGVIEKIKPTEPQVAQVRFSLYVPTISAFPLLIEPSSVEEDGVVKVDVIGRNVSKTVAENLELWIQICRGCTYAKEPSEFEKFDKTNGTDEHVRHRVFGDLNPGVFISRMTIEVKPPSDAPSFDISFDYSCKTCPVVEPWSQTIKVLLMR